MRRLDDKAKRKKFPLWLSEGERLLLEAKASEYGYTYLADYIRDAAIYESLVKINLIGSKEILDKFDEYNVEVRKYRKEVGRILKYATTLTENEKSEIQQGLYILYSINKKLRKEIKEKLDYEIIETLAKEKIEKQKINKISEGES